MKGFFGLLSIVLFIPIFLNTIQWFMPKNYELKYLNNALML